MSLRSTQSNVKLKTINAQLTDRKMDSTFTEKPVFEDPTNIDEQLKQIAEQYAINQSIGNILVKKFAKIKKLKEKK